MVELVDAPDSKSGSERSVGSIPTTRTTYSELAIRPEEARNGRTERLGAVSNAPSVPTFAKLSEIQRGRMSAAR